VPRSTAPASEEAHVLRLIEARYGNALPQIKLRTLLQRNPQLDPLDWSLVILSIEIELRVNMTPSLLNIGSWSVGTFARTVASLPKVQSATHTLDRLTLLVDELLTTQAISVPAQSKASSHQPKAAKRARPSVKRRSTT
jgi:hypothetical protein